MQLNLLMDGTYGLSSTSLGIGLAIIILTIVYKLLNTRDLPPGPMGLPIFGYWPFLKENTSHLQLEALKKKYGEVYSFTSFGRLYVNLGTAKVIREAHVNKSDCFGSRVTDFQFLSFLFEEAVAFNHGEAWKVQRKFFVQIIKERSAVFLKSSLSTYDSVHSTVEELRAASGNPVGIIQMLTHKCNAVMQQTLFGGTGITDEDLLRISELYGKVLAIQTPLNIMVTGNIAKFIAFPLMSGYREVMKNHTEIVAILRRILEEHKATYDGNHMRDIFDEYFRERNNRRAKGDATAEHFTDQALLGSLLQFMGDGILTVAAFISTILKVLIDHPEEQKRIYEELVEVVGQDRQPAIEDKSRLTYLNAFILESIRTTNFFPYFASMECTKETNLRGYRIPKGAITIINSWCSHFDPGTYEEPNKFKPSRYVTKDGKPRPELPMLFGVGKRACLGEGYTMMQVFLFLSTIIKNFSLSYPEDPETAYVPLVSEEMFICAHARSSEQK